MKFVILQHFVFIRQRIDTVALITTVYDCVEKKTKAFATKGKFGSSSEIYWQLHHWGGLNAHHTAMLRIGIQYASSLSNTMCLLANGAAEDTLSRPTD